MQIVDSQLHLWGANTPERPWPPGRDRDAQRPYPIGKETLLFEMDLAGVSRAVLVPPSWEGERNDLALAAARQYPDRFAVMGRLALQDPGVFDDLPAVCALAKRPNVAVKASGLVGHSVQAYPFRDVHDGIRKLFDAFGPRRTFWGTDLTRMPCTYRECIDLVHQGARVVEG
jgi:predicted TIM-barrel fold metal-dependent hydrolase